MSLLSDDPQWRQSVVGIRRKMKSSQAFPGSSSHLFLILRSFTRTLYYYCFSSPIHFAIVLFLPLHLFNQSCFQVPPVTSWPTASSLVLSFSAISYSGDEPQRKTWNVGCLNAFPLVAPKPHSRQPSLSALLLGVANGEVSQAGESARILSGRYSLRYLLANPLPCHSLRLVPRVWDGRKGQHQRRSRRLWGNWRNLNKSTNGTTMKRKKDIS